MHGKNLKKKLQLKAGQRVAVINPPAGYLDKLKPLPEGCEIHDRIDGNFDQIHMFVRNQEELSKLARPATQAIEKDGILWIAYPKKSAGVDTDLTRDEGWQPVYHAGYRPVALISIDKTWSAVRFRPDEGASPEEVVDAQYSGAKADLRSIYDRLEEHALRLGSDVRIMPRKTYVAFTRRVQFAIVQPSTRTRVDLGLRLKSHPPEGRLQDAAGFGSGSITHKVALSEPADLDDEVIGWMHNAYEEAG